MVHLFKILDELFLHVRALRVHSRLRVNEVTYIEIFHFVKFLQVPLHFISHFQLLFSQLSERSLSPGPILKLWSILCFLYSCICNLIRLCILRLVALQLKVSREVKIVIFSIIFAHLIDWLVILIFVLLRGLLASHRRAVNCQNCIYVIILDIFHFLNLLIINVIKTNICSIFQWLIYFLGRLWNYLLACGRVTFWALFVIIVLYITWFLLRGILGLIWNVFVIHIVNCRHGLPWANYLCTFFNLSISIIIDSLVFLIFIFVVFHLFKIFEVLLLLQQELPI